MSMRELARSMARLAWAAPLYGASRLAEALGGGRSAERLGSSLDAIAWSGHRRLGWLLQAVFQTGDDLAREWIDRFFDALDGGRSSPLQAAAGLAATAAEAARIAAPGAAGGAARQEWRNKLEVYFLVRGARARLGLPAAGPFDLIPFVERALELDPYRALWVLEGLGHDHAARVLAGDRQPEDVLDVEGLPPPALLMLHAGLGMALAEDVLGDLAPVEPDRAAVTAAAERFARLCRANSRRGFADAALESLGLVTRCFFPDLVPALDRALRRVPGPLHGYFWHGVGRALYFLPVNFLPGYGSGHHALAMARREAPCPQARRDALTGAVYALALVNLSHPAVVEDLLRREGAALDGGAFTEGLVSSLLMRRATTPDDPGLATFLAYRPDPSDAALAGRWRELVTRPVAEALDGGRGAPDRGGEVYRALSHPGAFGGLTAGGGVR